MPYELRTFGGLNLLGPDGEPAEGMLAHSKGMALLVYLAVEAPARGVGRSQAAALLWPERDERRARTALRVTLTRIRKTTDRPLVEGKGESRLRPARERLETDIWAFREALNRGDVERALSLYRGDFLAGFQVADAPEFERWADNQRERLRDRAHEAALTAGRRAREAGDGEAATGAFERAQELRPFREESAVELVRTLAEQGRPAEALRRYEAFRKRREEELELPPPEELERLVQRIRAGEVERPGVEAEGATQAGETPEPRAVRPDGETENGTGSAAPSGTGELEVKEPKGRFGRRAVLSAVAVLALVVVAFGLWTFEGLGSGGSGPPSGDRSVAVLPFEAIGTEEPGPIAEGLHTDLLSRLSNVSGLKVISGTSVERFRGTDIPLPAIADSLGVRWVVEGDVQQSDGAIQVNAQLIDPRTDTHAWAETYRRAITSRGLFDLQSDLTKKIARSLEAEFSPDETERVERRPTENMEAYRLYLRGRRALVQRVHLQPPDEALRRAIDYFRRAIEQDSSFALAWAGLADAAGYHRSPTPQPAAPPGVEQEAAARRALELGPDLAETHASMGYAYINQRNAPAALRELKRALALKPSSWEAHSRAGYLYLMIGRPQEAVEHLTVAAELNPQHAYAQWYLAAAYLTAGKVEESLKQVRQTRRRLQGTTDSLAVRPGSLAALTVTNEVRALYELGRLDEARRLAKEHLENGHTRVLRVALVAIEAAAGDTVAARKHLGPARKQVDRGPSDRRAAYMGLLHATLGETDRAFEAWEEIETESWATFPAVGYLRYGILINSSRLRDDPRYQELIREANRAWGLNPDGSLPDSVDVSFSSSADD